MGFFIGDLHRHIERLHSEQFSGHHVGDSFTVYRGQGMSNTDFDQVVKMKGGLMSFNNFLSTSKDRNVSVLFAESNQSNPDLVGILFVLTIDPLKSSAPFASINGVSHFQVEDEVLFSMHTVFRIGKIKPMDETHRLFQVELTLTSDNDKDLRVLTTRIREETFPEETGWQRLGLLLIKTGQSTKSQQIYEILLEQASNDNEKANIYERLGNAKYHQGEYKQALELYEKSLEIYQKTCLPNHLYLAWPYNNIGNVYYSMGEYPKALSFYEKSLEIRQQTLPPNHPDLAASYNNIGNVYYSMADYPKALSSYEKSLEIEQQSLPQNHPNSASTYNNIGEMYRSMGEYQKALSSYEKALEIRQQSLPLNHPHLATSYNNMGLVYENMGNYSKACSFYERAIEIGQHSLSSNHPHLQLYRKNLDIVEKKL